MKNIYGWVVGLGLVFFLSGCFTTKPSAEEIESSNKTREILLKIKTNPQNYKTCGSLQGARSVPSIMSRIDEDRLRRERVLKNRVSITLGMNTHPARPRVGERFVRFWLSDIRKFSGSSNGSSNVRGGKSYNPDVIELFKSVFIVVKKSEIEVINQRISEIKKREALKKEAKKRENPSLDTILEFVSKNLASFRSSTTKNNKTISGKMLINNSWRNISISYGIDFISQQYEKETNKFLYSKLSNYHNWTVARSSVNRDKIDLFISLFNKLELPKKLKKQKKEEEKAAEIEKYVEEMGRIDVVSKQAGYVGFSNYDIINLIITTQEKGGLEKYLNQTVGIIKDDPFSLKREYQKIKAIQVLEKGVLYSYSSFKNGRSFHMTIYVKKDHGKIYQEGQSLQDMFYVFTGMFSYISTTGAKKTVPSFRNANLIFNNKISPKRTFKKVNKPSEKVGLDQLLLALEIVDGSKNSPKITINICHLDYVNTIYQKNYTINDCLNRDDAKEIAILFFKDILKTNKAFKKEGTSLEYLVKTHYMYLVASKRSNALNAPGFAIRTSDRKSSNADKYWKRVKRTLDLK